jgi:aminoglycoside phosphotransferase (APT) family kinase protein
MTEAAAAFRAAIAAARPDLATAPLIVHTRGWDSDAVEMGGTIFKFPKRPEAVDRLRREARLLALIRPRLPLAVPDMRLHETPRFFSEHAAIPGEILETQHYDALSGAQQQALAETLAAFYATLHAVPIDQAVAAGVEPKPEWPPAESVLPILVDRLPARLLGFARAAFAAYAALPREPEILGYFDGHGWNMAFDRHRGVLNGVYDFADAELGPPSRDFTYANLTSGDLGLAIVAAYVRLTGREVDPRTVAVRTAVQMLAELAEPDAELDSFLASAVRWHDYMQARSELRIEAA